MTLTNSLWKETIDFNFPNLKFLLKFAILKDYLIKLSLIKNCYNYYYV